MAKGIMLAVSDLNYHSFFQEVAKCLNRVLLTCDYYRTRNAFVLHEDTRTG